MKNEVDLKEYLQGKKVLDIKMFSVNENYFVKQEGESYLIDGAIQLELEEGKFFTVGFSDQHKMFEYQPVEAELLFESLAYEDLIIHDFDLSHFKNQSIIKVEFKWGWYREYNEDFELKEDKEYIPIAMILEFNNSHKLFVASVNFDIMSNEIVNLNYNLEAMLLVANHDDFAIENIFIED